MLTVSNVLIRNARVRIGTCVLLIEWQLFTSNVKPWASKHISPLPRCVHESHFVVEQKEVLGKLKTISMSVLLMAILDI